VGPPSAGPGYLRAGHQDNTLASLELTVAPTSQWQNHFTVFEDHQNLINDNPLTDPGRAIGGFDIDTPYYSIAKYNRSGFEYQALTWSGAGPKLPSATDPKTRMESWRINVPQLRAAAKRRCLRAAAIHL